MAGSSDDFLNYSKGMDRLQKFVPGKWMLIVTIGWGIWAWYDHTVLALLAVAGLFVSNVAASVADGLIITHSAGGQGSVHEGQNLERTVVRLEKELEQLKVKLAVDYPPTQC